MIIRWLLWLSRQYHAYKDARDCQHVTPRDEWRREDHPDR
jgi:hypothetical protein